MIYLSDIAKEYSFDEMELVKFFLELKKTASEQELGPYTKDAIKGIGLTRSSDKDFLVQAYMPRYEEKANMEIARLSAEKEETKALSGILITSGFNFDGYKVTKYSGYISGDDVAEIPRETVFSKGMVTGHLLTDALVKIRRQALLELKKAAYDLGCNAVIGVDFDYLTFEPERNSVLNSQVTIHLPYVICVTANGNAVVIEKEE